MKTVWTLATLLVASIALSSPVSAAPNQQYSGSNTTDCADYNVFYGEPGLRSPLIIVVPADDNTIWHASSSSGQIWVDYYLPNDVWYDYNSAGNTVGVVPNGVVEVGICVGVLEDYPDIPDPTATWTYQDGF